MQFTNAIGESVPCQLDAISSDLIVKVSNKKFYLVLAFVFSNIDETIENS